MKPFHQPKVGGACSGWGLGVQGGPCHEWHGLLGGVIRVVRPKSMVSAGLSWPKLTVASSCFVSG